MIPWYQQIWEWLKTKNLNSHIVVAGIVFMAGLLTSDQQVRDLFIKAFSKHPDIVAYIFSIAGIIFKYSHSSSDPRGKGQ